MIISSYAANLVRQNQRCLNAVAMLTQHCGNNVSWPRAVFVK